MLIRQKADVVFTPDPEIRTAAESTSFAGDVRSTNAAGSPHHDSSATVVGAHLAVLR